jgi:hypothetical protein
VIFLRSEEELNNFLLRLNSFHENVKYTWDIGYQRISFLDVSVRLDNGSFCTDVYSKPTDAHQYFNFKSCHPPHVKSGIPYGQALRLKRICHSDKVFESRLQELKGFLVKRCYNSEFVESQFKRVRILDRSSLFKRESEQIRRENNKSTFIIDYHQALRELYGIFRELQNIVGLSGKFLSVMPEPPMVCFRRSKNLKDHLVRARLQKLEVAAKGMVKCGRGGGGCKVCDSIVVRDTFESTVQRRTFHINHLFDCNSQRVVYLITCGKCSKQYVGNTVTSFRFRFNNHKSSLNRFSKGQRGLCGQHLYEHFFEEGHSGFNDFNF